MPPPSRSSSRPPASPSPPSASRPVAVAGAAVVLSGVAALVYEICWIRQAALAFGATTPALSTVLAVFFGGLALGSELFGRRAATLRRPFRVFAILELCVAVLASLTPWSLALADALYGAAYRALGDGSFILSAIRAGLVALVLLPPTVLMGGALPVLCRVAVRRREHITGSVGTLYGLNTLGATLGCLAAGLWWIPSIGVRATLGLGAVANVVAALLTWDRDPREEGEPSSRSAASSPPRVSSDFRRGTVALLFFLVGFVALGYEVLWTRHLALLLRGTVVTYTVTLAVVLAGIVLGSLVVARVLDRVASRSATFGALQVASGLMVLGLLLLPAPLWRGLGQGPIVAFLLLLPPAVLSGASFPLAVRLAVDDVAQAGAGLGRMAAANTAGGILGALATGFVALPALGMDGTLRLLTGLALASGWAAWWLLRPGPRVGRLVSIVVTAGAWLAIPPLLGTKLPDDHLTDGDEELMAAVDGRGASLAVLLDDGVLTLEIDRWWQGEDRPTHQIMAAHVPMLLHPDPRRVLVVGAGTGQTPSRFLLHDVERVDCVDIEPAVFDVIRTHFDDGWMDDPRVTLLREDGRALVAHGEGEYDVVSLELGQVFRSGVASFYTMEFYEQAAERLSDGGLLSQFVPLPFLGGEELRRIVASFRAVFPTSLLWSNTAELLLVGVKGDRFATSRERIERALARPELGADLRFGPWGGPDHWPTRLGVLLGGFLMGPEGLSALAGDAEVYRDDRPALEYAAGRVPTTATLEVDRVADLRSHLGSIEKTLPVVLDAQERALAASTRELSLGDIVASARLREVDALAAAGDIEGVLRAVDAALAANPQSVEAHRLRGDALMLSNRLDEALPSFETALAIAPADRLARRGLAFTLHRLGSVEESLPHYRSLLQRSPDDAEARNNFGVALAQAGDFAAAIEQFEEVLRLEPGFPGVEENLERARGAAAGDR